MVLPDEVHDSGDLSGKLSFYRTSRSVSEYQENIF